MTYKTRVKALIAANLVLLASLVFGLLFSLRGSEKRGANIPLLAAAKAGNLREIILRGEGGDIVLRLGEGGRPSILLEGTPFPADPAKTERLLEVLGAAKLSRTVTEKNELRTDFGVEDEAARRIILSGDAGRVEIILGREEGEGPGQYIRFAGGDGVYLLSERLSYYAEQKVPYWSGLRLFPPEIEGRDITSVTVEGRTVSRIFREKGPEGLRWLTEGEKAVNQAAADGLSNALARIAGASFAADTRNADTGFDAPELRVGYTTADKKTFAVEIGRAADANHRYCRASAEGALLPYVYLLSSHSYEGIRKFIGDLFGDEG